MDWQLIVGLASAASALLLLAVIEGREDDESLPPPDRSVEPPKDLWITSGGRSSPFVTTKKDNANV